MTRKHVLPRLALACGLFLVPQIAAAAPAAEPVLERLALCQDSWLDWQKAADPRLPQIAAHFRAAYTHSDNDPFAIPKAPTTILGLRVVQVYPSSVGMGVGFSVLVDAPFDKARPLVERAVGKPLAHCDTSDGMKSCELGIAEKRTLTLMTQDDPKIVQTLIGCYYYYEK
ncbi:MAG TPA: hypothetical protein VNU97_09250 [Rhizomicrobium sp.]|jgi:hypothetical protein|nr:hypothetical protein [Rhizomicrobium sp.]